MSGSVPSAWAVVIGLGTPLLCILIIAAGLVIRELRHWRMMRELRRDLADWAEKQ